MDGKITIARPYGGTGYIEINLEDAASKIQFCVVRMTYENFAKAITGMGYVDCEFQLRGIDIVGMNRETKALMVFVPDGPYETQDQRARQAVEGLEKDGLIGRVEDAKNFHKRKSVQDGGAWYEVHFHRFVAKS